MMRAELSGLRLAQRIEQAPAWIGILPAPSAPALFDSHHVGGNVSGNRVQVTEAADWLHLFAGKRHVEPADVRAALTWLGITHGQFAEAVGMSRQWVSRALQGNMRIYRDKADGIRQALRTLLVDHPEAKGGAA